MQDCEVRVMHVWAGIEDVRNPEVSRHAGEGEAVNNWNPAASGTHFDANQTGERSS
jgi:hypothetical protein